MCIRDSVKIASGLANPSSLVSKYLIPSNKVCETNSGKISFRLEKVTPVSYTHLDVYKRQEYKSGIKEI